MRVVQISRLNASSSQDHGLHSADQRPSYQRSAEGTPKKKNPPPLHMSYDDHDRNVSHIHCFT